MGLSARGTDRGRFDLSRDHVNVATLDIDRSCVPTIDDGGAGVDLLVTAGTGCI